MFLSPIHCLRATFDGSRTWVMGVVNVTPDSFSDGGRFAGVEAAVAEARRLVDEGADLVDVGGESTRPGATPVDEGTELGRVVPVIEALASVVGVPLSVDTRRGAVARAALAAGASLVNDVSGGRDPSLLAAAAAANAPLVVGHLRGEPQTMQRGIHFDALLDEVASELAARVAAARAAGVTQLIVDPGIGFGKTTAHNLELLGRAGELSRRLGLPVMVGPSRKRFLGELAGVDAAADRLFPSVGAAVAAALRGADFVRVHDVRAVRQALSVADAVARSARGDGGQQELGR
jgi:dihydropteroate synthase